MLTRMTEKDWTVVLEVFRAARSRRGDKGRDDRRFLEALHRFAVHNVTLAGASGRVRALEQRPEALLAAEPGRRLRGFLPGAGGVEPDRAPRPDVRQRRGAGARLGRRRQRGQRGQALGRSRGGFSTKIHLKCDFDGLPLDFHLTGGEASDSWQFETLLGIGPGIDPRAVVTDKGSDSKANRNAARDRGIVPVIPHKANAKNRPGFFPKALHRARARIEQAIGKPERFKRIALRCEKTAENYAAFVAFACGLILVISVHTA